MSLITNEHEFQKSGEAAEAIFRYLRKKPAVKNGPWAFDQGNVDADQRSAHAVFSHVANSGWGKDTLYITAQRKLDGSWDVKHTIERAA